MRYGLPYKGSKNAIAEWIIDNLPAAETFCDLFFGGGAVTHRAIISGKYKEFVANDIDDRLTGLFVDCCNGKYTVENHPEWVTREEFNAKKETDAYIALVWSFGNNGIDYLYAKDLEAQKHDYHVAVYEDRPELLQKYGLKIKSTHKKDVYERYLEFNRQIKETSRNDLREIERLESMERLSTMKNLQSIEGVKRLQSIEGVKSKIKITSVDYTEVDTHGGLIYCDPPYAGTDCGKYSGFDSKRFYEWAEAQENIFISEYWMPDVFIPYAWREKTVLSDQNGTAGKVKEMIYTNKRTYDRLSDDRKELVSFNFAKQSTIFDFLKGE